MADDDETAGDAVDPTFANAGPRRSTFTPRSAADGTTDDDALADALLQEYTRLGSGTLNLPPQRETEGSPEAEGGPSAAQPGGVPPVVPASTPPVAAAPLGGPQVPSSTTSAPTAAPPASPPPGPATPPPWSGAPAPDPAQAVAMEAPVGLDTAAISLRRQLVDDELLRALAEAGSRPDGAAAMMQLLQDQLRMRDEGAAAAPQAATEDAGGDLAQDPQPSDAARATFVPSFAPPPVPRSQEPVAAASPFAPRPVEPTPPVADETSEVETGEVEPGEAETTEVEPVPSLEPAADQISGDEISADQISEAETTEVEPGPSLEPAADQISGDEISGDEISADQTSADETTEVEPDSSLEPAADAAELEQPRDASPGEPTAAPTDELADDSPDEAPPALVEPPRPGQAFVPPADPSTADLLFVEPLPVAAGESVPADTGTVTIVDPVYQDEIGDDDVVDETDRVGLADASPAVLTVQPDLVLPPSGPIATMRVPVDEIVIVDHEPVRPPVFRIERSGPEPTPLDQRVGAAARMFWLWLAANSSVLSVGLGAAVFASGMSLRQAIVAVLAGIALSFLPLGLTTLAGKRSGQPTMVVSRATFGVLGNIVPAAVAFLTRLFWAGVMLWLLGTAVAIVLVGAGSELGDRMLLLVGLAVAFVIATVVAVFGYAMLAKLQLGISVLAGLLVIGLVGMTAPAIDLSQALTRPDGPWLLTIGGAVLVFSFTGLAWANSGADLARYQRAGTGGAATMLWATFGAMLPAFVLIAYGALLAASNPELGAAFATSPLDALATLLPGWYPVPLLAAAALSLLSGLTVVLYSSGFALQSAGIRVPRFAGVLIGAVLAGALSLVFAFLVPGGVLQLFADVATTVAVPTAAWAGIFAAETMIRNRRFESGSLTRRGGVYADVRWVNLIALLLITAIGFALTSATVTWLSWQGYGFTLLGLPLDGELARTDVGVLVALVLGLLTPIALGIPAIRKQEATRLDA